MLKLLSSLFRRCIQVVLRTRWVRPQNNLFQVLTVHNIYLSWSIFTCCRGVQSTDCTLPAAQSSACTHTHTHTHIYIYICVCVFYECQRMYTAWRKNLNSLQRVQNSLARLVCNALYRSPSQPLFKSLHWLTVMNVLCTKSALGVASIPS